MDIRNSDGTLLLTWGEATGGTLLTLRACRRLWHRQTVGRIHVNPVSFATDGRRHIADGNALLVFGLPSS